MKDAADMVTKRLNFIEVNDGYVSEPVESIESLTKSEAVMFLEESGRYEILGIERACDGNSHDADGNIEFTDIGCAHSEWYDFNVSYVEVPGWSLGSENIIVSAFTDIDLKKWSEYYGLWAAGECIARHVLAKDINSGETVLLRIEDEWDYDYRSTYDREKTKKPENHTHKKCYRMTIKMAAKKTNHKNDITR